MKTTKCLLYCTKAKPYLFDLKGCKVKERYMCEKSILREPLNGRIVAECEVKTAKIDIVNIKAPIPCYRVMDFSWVDNELTNYSKLTRKELYEYLGRKGGYVLNIKSLTIYDYAFTMREFLKGQIQFYDNGDFKGFKKAPQNMEKVYGKDGNEYVLISIRPEWLCKILNGGKTIEIRKKVLKGMCDDE